MSKINFNNYESYLLDYAEGTLSTLDKFEMDLFLQKHPKILEQLIQFNLAPNLSQTQIQLSSTVKSALKKDEFSFTKTQLNNLLIKEVEQDLSLEELNSLEKQNNSDAFLRERKLFAATKLIPDLTIKFIDKESLKKRSKIIPFYYSVSVAAALIVVFGVYYLFNAQQNTVANSFNKKQFAFAEIKTNKVAHINNATTKPITNKLTIPLNFANKLNRPVLQVIKANPYQKLVVEKDFNQLALYTVVENKNEVLPVANSTTIKSDYLTLNEFFKKKVKQAANKNQNDNLAYIHQQKINSYDVATIAVNAIAMVSGKKIALEKTYTNQGELKEVTLVGEKFEFSTKK